jgi:hypothetical protein
VSIIHTLKKLVDPAGARQEAAELKRRREQPTREDDGAPPARFRCRVCRRVGPEATFCPDCLAGTMVPLLRSEQP